MYCISHCIVNIKTQTWDTFKFVSILTIVQKRGNIFRLQNYLEHQDNSRAFLISGLTQSPVAL